MRNMLALFAAVLLTVVGAGWYLGWYKVRSQAASVPGQHSVNIDIDTHKITNDLQQGEAKLQKMLENKVKEEAQKVPDARKTATGLTLPSPELKINTGGGSALEVKSSGNGPTMQFHADKGPTFQIGDSAKAPVLQFGNPNKGTLIQIGTTEPK